MGFLTVMYLKFKQLTPVQLRHQAFIALVCNETCGFISVDEVIRLMIKGGIISRTLARCCQGAFSPTQRSQTYNPVGESLFECLLQRHNDLSGKSESAIFSADHT